MSIHPLLSLLLAALLVAPGVVLRAESVPEVFVGCHMVQASWADGDSFPAVLPDGRRFIVRIYGADCIETAATNETLARRLRAQRRYFGISEDLNSGDSVKLFGLQAAKRTAELLAKPFTLETSFTDARGSGVSQRIYGYVTLEDGRDLSTVLVEEGLARAFGVTRGKVDGTSAGEYRAHLADLELVAAASRRGIWAKTDWAKLATERENERREEHEIDVILCKVPPSLGLDPNNASTELLETLPGIGPVLAARWVSEREARPFQSVDDLRRVKGISNKTLEGIAPYLRFGDAED